MTVIDDEFKKAIGKRFSSLRKEKGLTREMLIEKLNTEYYLDIDEKTLRRYENGTYIPKIDNLILFSEFFGVSLDYLIYGKQTSDDNSFTWKDSLKRLNRLIFSSVLIPKSEEDQGSPFYGKYYFLAFDDEVAVYMKRLESFAKNQNYNFEVRDQKIQFDISDWDNLIGDFENYTDDLSPSKSRLNDILIASREDPEQYLQKKIETIIIKQKK